MCECSGETEHRGEASTIATLGSMRSEKRLVRLSRDLKIEQNFAGTDCAEGTRVQRLGDQ